MKHNKIWKVFVCGMVLYASVDVSALHADETRAAKEVLYVNFNNQVHDQSGNNHHGDAVGEPSFVAGLGTNNQALFIQNPDGNAEGGRNPKQYVDFGTTLTFGKEDYAIAFWWKDARSQSIAGDSGGSIIANKNYDSGNNKGFAIGSFTNDIRVNFNATSARKEHRINNFEDGKWHHIAVNYDRDGNMTTYIDGVKKGETSIGDQRDGSIDVEGNHFAIGADGKLQNGLSGGYYDDLHVYEGLLDQTNIKQLYDVYAKDLESNEKLEAIRQLDEQLNQGNQAILDPAYHVSDIQVYRLTHDTIAGLQPTDLTIAQIQANVQLLKDASTLLNAKRELRNDVSKGKELIAKEPQNVHANALKKAMEAVEGLAFDRATLDVIEKMDRDLTKAIQRFQLNDQRKMSFAVLSDTHVGSGGDTNSKYLLDAMNDLKQREPLTDTILIAGDITQNGTKAEYANLTNLMETNWFSQGMNAVMTQGNHDVRWLCGTNPAGSSDPNASSSFCGVEDNYQTRYLPLKKQWLDTDVNSDTKDKVYYDTWIHDYHFISLNTEKDLKDRAYISDEQLNWFKATLAENADKNRPIFVTLHQPLEDTHARSTYWTIGDQDKKIKEILKDYPQVVFISGHIHNGVGVAGIVNNGYGTMLDAISLAQNENGLNQQQIGYIVNVYDTYTQVRVYDFKNDMYLDAYEMIIDAHIEETYQDQDDIAVDTMEIQVSSSLDENNPVVNMLDNNKDTIWRSNDVNTVITMDLKGTKLVNGLRYLPTQNYKNDGISAGGRSHQMQGFIENYRIEVSNDDQKSWKTVKEGTWQSNNYWKRVAFPSQKATHIRLVSLGSPNYNTNTYLTAAELRVTGSNYDVQAYQEKVANYRALPLEGYTKSSTTAFKTVLDQAMELQYQEVVEETQLQAMLDHLHELQQQFVLRASQSDFLQACYYIQSFELLSATSYTDASWKNLKAQYDDLKNSIEVMEECAQKTLLAQIAAYQDAFAALEKLQGPQQPKPEEGKDPEEGTPNKPDVKPNQPSQIPNQQPSSNTTGSNQTLLPTNQNVIKNTGQKPITAPNALMHNVQQRNAIPFSTILCGAGIVMVAGLVFIKKRESLKSK